MTSGRYRHIDAYTRATTIRKARGLIQQGWTRTAAARALAPSLGVHPNTVSNWVRHDIQIEPCTTMPALQDQVRRLTQELAAAQAIAQKLIDDRSALDQAAR